MNLLPLNTSRYFSLKSSVGFSICSRSVSVLGKAPLRAPSSGTITLFAVLFAMFLPGCNVFLNARRTMFHEPAQFSWKVDRKHSIKAYRAWADQAWDQQLSGMPEVPYSCDYEGGFKDGFVDFVNAGGNGEPPPVPPRKYWNLDYRNPPGEPAAADWFAGFRHGARVAREGGYRDKATIESSVFCLGPQKSNSYQNFYPEGIEELSPNGSESMELLPPGEFDFESQQEIHEQEELTIEGPMISQPPLESMPILPVPDAPSTKAPSLQAPVPQSSSPQSPASKKPAPQSPLPQPRVPKPAQEAEPSSDLDDLFGNRRIERPSVVRGQASAVRNAKTLFPAGKQAQKVSSERFVR